MLNTFDLQLFADPESAPAEPAPQENTDPPSESEQPKIEPPTEEQKPVEPEKPDYSKLGTMDTQDQYDYLKQMGVFGDKPVEPDKKIEDKPEEKPTEPAENIKSRDEPPKQEEPEIEITLNGQRQKVKPSEIEKIVSDQRRELDAVLAAAKVQQASSQPADKKPQEKAQDEYHQAISQAEKDLGINPGEFNQFDPTHNFALQKVIAKTNTQQNERQAVQSEITDFVRTAQADPLTPQIDASFDTYLFKLGSESPEGAKKAQDIIFARQRFFNKQATKADTALLKEHWNYVKEQLSKPVEKTKPQPVVKPKPEPPKTEQPGTGKAVDNNYKLDYSKLGHAKPQDQLAMLKKAGYLNTKG